MQKIVLVLSSHTPSLFWFRLDMMREFVARGWQVYAVANESEKQWKHVFLEYGIEYRKIEVQRNGVNPINDFKTLYSIYRVLKSIHPEKIFAFQADYPKGKEKHFTISCQEKTNSPKDIFFLTERKPN